MFTTSYASSDPTPAVSAIGGCAAVPWDTATTDLSPQRGFSASDAAPAEGWCDPVDTALGNVVSRLEDIERRRRELEAEHLEALHEAFDIAAAESENAYALYPSGKSGELAYRAVRAEVAAALQMSERTVEKHIAHAYTVRNNYAATLTALREGRISVRHVQTITDAGLIIGGGDDPGSVTRRADYEARALRVAERDTPTRAHSGVEVQIITTADRLGLTIPNTDSELLNNSSPLGEPERPHQQGAPSVAQTPATQQRRHGSAPVLLDLEGVTHAHPPPSILDGYGPIPDSVVRECAAVADRFETVLVTSGIPIGIGADGIHEGQVLSVDAYRPTAKIRRTLDTRDRTCRFPGCRMAATHCDIDHTIAAADDGPTDTQNLANLCRSHHTLKHETGWSVTQQPGGIMQWQSPTGRTHATLPEPQNFTPVAPVYTEEHDTVPF